jgi:hypothetical protein
MAEIDPEDVGARGGELGHAPRFPAGGTKGRNDSGAAGADHLTSLRYWGRNIAKRAL